MITIHHYSLNFKAPQNLKYCNNHLFSADFISEFNFLSVQKDLPIVLDLKTIIFGSF